MHSLSTSTHGHTQTHMSLSHTTAPRPPARIQHELQPGTGDHGEFDQSNFDLHGPNVHPTQAAAQNAGTSSFAVTALFVEKLCKDFKLEAEQSTTLHTFSQLGGMDPNVSHFDLATRVFMLGIILSQSAELQRQARHKQLEGIDMKVLLQDLYIRLEDTFIFSKEQRANMRSIAQDVMYQHTRTTYKTMHVDVEKILRTHSINYSFNNVFGKPAREQQLVQELKKVCSSVRNAFRLDLVKSLFGKHTEPLSRFTFNSAMKYKQGGNGEGLDPKFMIHLAILRRFCIDHPEIAKAQLLTGSESDVDSELEEGNPTPRKRRKGTGGGRIPNGEDFWSRMDKFFADGIAARGRSLTAEPWKVWVYIVL
ncbi:hypothetical protein EUX98_g7618 [Antrodiella citrinella]|uniref:Uncharacterized protein n=1 Tax=Antrodiella citrinella TaxID=2447956 RepID=A0A4S4ML40_9APHY|nr:hypothetical protein EUX98_g7618 [Antrodiella citrinella]